MFENVKTSGKKQNETSISFTIDDLVLLIGEKVVENKLQARILDFQKKKIAGLEEQSLEFQSQKMSIEQTINELKVQHEKTISNLQVHVKDLETKLSEFQITRHEYIVSLEDKLHGVVLERDELRKEAGMLRQKKEKKMKVKQKSRENKCRIP